MSQNRMQTPFTSGKYFVGIDAGSISINCAVINDKRALVFTYPYHRHLGKIEEHIDRLIRDLFLRFGKPHIESISFTGNHGKKLSETLGGFYEFETISQVVGSLFLVPDAESIISMGGQETALFQINHHGSGWDLEFFNTNGPCAAGTGSFIDQQAQRLATSIYAKQVDGSANRIDDILTEFIARGSQSDKPASVACRCTVFTKSDMIHLQNKGERLEDIIYGLHLGNARNYISTIVSNRKLSPPILFIGGLSLNRLQIKAFREYFPDLVVPEHSTSAGALGVALQAFDTGQKHVITPDRLTRSRTGNDLSVPVGAKLSLIKTVFPETNDIQRKPFHTRMSAYLGIDIGSTTTKYALIGDAREIIRKCYVPTQGKPIETTQDLLKNLEKDMGKGFEIAGVATTGSGRNVVGDFLSADLIIDEITAHAKGAAEIDAAVDTIFEIGGQDSKYIYIANTYPLDFDMNKVCAAGTGSFLHELANKYGVNIVGEFQEIALASDRPVKLAERCTVFMESDLVSYHQKGIEKTDLIAGLCYAIVYNYLNRVVEKRKIGRRIMFLGGPSLNKGVVAAFENVLDRALVVPKHREVLGAFGAALAVQGLMRPKKNAESTFRGIETVANDQMDYVEKVCRADHKCQNECKLKIFNFDGRRSVWGGECGRYESAASGNRKKRNLFKFWHDIWQAHMTGVSAELKDEPLYEIDGRPTVGMMRALYGLQTSVLWAHFFDQLGFRLVLTPPTNQQMVSAGIEKMIAETCFPVKVSHGHAKQILDQTRYMFLPTLIDMPTPESTERGFYCPLVQSNAYMLRAAFRIDPPNLLSPVIHLKHDPDTLCQEISGQIRSRLRVSGKAVKFALMNALEKQKHFINELYHHGKEILDDTEQDQPLVVVTGRPYNLYDERLNLRLGQNLAKIGLTALPMDFIDVSSVDLSDFPSMYWALGAQIIRTAKRIKKTPHHFGLHLTNFGCGADSFIEHFYKHIMGDKPFLILELDEHSGVAGVMTRLEAFRNVIDNAMQRFDASVKSGLKAVN